MLLDSVRVRRSSTSTRTSTKTRRKHWQFVAPSLSGLQSPNNLRSERAELSLDFFVLVLVLLDQFIQNYERIVIAAREKTPTTSMANKSASFKTR